MSYQLLVARFFIVKCEVLISKLSCGLPPFGRVPSFEIRNSKFAIRNFHPMLNALCPMLTSPVSWILRFLTAYRLRLTAYYLLPLPLSRFLLSLVGGSSSDKLFFYTASPGRYWSQWLFRQEHFIICSFCLFSPSWSSLSNGAASLP